MRRDLSVVVCIIVAGSCGASTSESENDPTELLAIHEQVLEAHRTGDVPSWMAVEADPYVVASRGTITFPTAEEREAFRAPYLASTSFSVYRDMRPPLVRISDDGTLGWLIAEVEVQGTQTAESGDSVAVDAVWAWIELYEKRDGQWKLVGNVSNRRS